VVHAWSSTACWWLVVYAKFIGTAIVTTAPLFHIEVIDDWARSRLPCSRCVAGRLCRHSSRIKGEGGSEVRAYRREKRSWCLAPAS
jgi:hypothetical protein